jgi:hypothetical protein
MISSGVGCNIDLRLDAFLSNIAHIHANLMHLPPAAWAEEIACGARAPMFCALPTAWSLERPALRGSC